MDILQWMIDSSAKQNPWSATRIVQITLGLWFGSIHQRSDPCSTLANISAQAIVYALYNLCHHLQYINALRVEIILPLKENETGDPFEKLFLLDSLLKGSARFSPSGSSELQRLQMTDHFISISVYQHRVSFATPQDNRPLQLYRRSISKGWRRCLYPNARHHERRE